MKELVTKKKTENGRNKRRRRRQVKQCRNEKNVLDMNQVERAAYVYVVDMCTFNALVAKTVAVVMAHRIEFATTTK